MDHTSDLPYITELIPTSTLQRFQDAFSEMTGMAALTTDASGKPVTEGSNFTDFCMNLIRKSPEGCKNCEYCDKHGAEITLETGKATHYHCHAGLMDFAAPIMADGQMIGSFIGGQVMPRKLEESKIRTIARSYDIDEDALWEAANKVYVCPENKLNSAVDALYSMATVLSNMAYGKYQALEANAEVERAANMKTDFLANMSHEIRTPMNAVIGMAEMALRENLPDNAREYINQIKSSGRALLNLINDILDFSKIESGKMEIVPAEYETLSLFNDVANIVSTRLRDKPIQLLLEIAPTFPHKLYGDNLRIRQVLINLANNAVKFTKRGRVKLIVDYDKLDDDTVLTKIQVKDTGIGIKPEDLKKLFQSFQQVDSKRNRNVEGTGLGLAISKRLVETMGGSIHVESEYEVGSTFSFTVPQKVIDWSPTIQVKEAANAVAFGYWGNRYLARQFYLDTNRLRVFSSAVTAPEEFEEALNTYADVIKGKKVYLFFEKYEYNEGIKEILEAHPEVTGIELIPFFDQAEPSLPNIRIFKEPLSSVSIAMALNNEEFHMGSEDSGTFEFDFTAPEAEVLIVDDNAINLTVAEGLLEPLKMKISSALSGMDAIDQIGKKKFDLIFMDHMMPEMDGVETTRVIRRLHPDYNDVPIIALTANAVGGTKEMFLSEGMNDFVPKPIEVQVIISKVKQWLPIEKIIKGSAIVAKTDSSSEEHFEVGDLDTDSARKLLGNDKLFWGILKEYYKGISRKAELIRGYKEAKDWPAYTIEVHALKSASKQIGAMELSNMAAELEKAGNARDTAYIQANTDPMLERYLSYIPVFAPFCEEEKKEEPKNEFDREAVLSLFDQLHEAADNLDMDAMEEIMQQIDTFSFPDECASLVDELREAVGNIDGDTCDEIMEQLRNLL